MSDNTSPPGQHVKSERLRFTGRADLEATVTSRVAEHCIAHGMDEWPPELRERVRRLSMAIAEVL